MKHQMCDYGGPSLNGWRGTLTSWTSESFCRVFKPDLVLTALFLAAEIEEYGRVFLYGIHRWKVDAKSRTKR